jgi:uncharacterized protein
VFGFLFATKVVLPKVLQGQTFSRRWPLRHKLSFYPSIKEAIYLSQQPELLEQKESCDKKIYFRPEPWSAQYYKGPLNFFDDTLLALACKYKIVILPRDKNQVEHYRQQKFAKMSIAEKPLSLSQIVADCLLFIGAGGSMTREIAVMGIPVVSIYQDRLLQADHYLIDYGLLQIAPQLTMENVEILLSKRIERNNDLSVLAEGKQSFIMLKEILFNLKKP